FPPTSRTRAPLVSPPCLGRAGGHRGSAPDFPGGTVPGATLLLRRAMARGRRPQARRVQTRTTAMARSAKEGEHAPSGDQGSARTRAMQEEPARRGATAVPAAWTGDPAVWEAVEESLSTLTVKRRRFLKNFLASGHIANSVHAAGYNVKDNGSAND